MLLPSRQVQTYKLPPPRPFFMLRASTPGASGDKSTAKAQMTNQKKKTNGHRLQGRDAREDSFRRCCSLTVRDAVPLSQSVTRSLSSVRDCGCACACERSSFKHYRPPFLGLFFFFFDWNTRATRRVVPFLPQKALRKPHQLIPEEKNKKAPTHNRTGEMPRTLLVACLEDVRVLRRKLHFRVYRCVSPTFVAYGIVPISRHHALSLFLSQKTRISPIRLVFVFLFFARTEVVKSLLFCD